MAPSALNISQSPLKSPDPAGLNTKCAVTKTNPSPKGNFVCSNLQELNASKIDFNLNSSPKAVPELNSPEVWTQNAYENCTNVPSKCGLLMKCTQAVPTT